MHFRSVVVATLLLTTASVHSRTPILMAGTTSASQLPYTRNSAATTHIKTSVEEFVLWVDETKWKQQKSDNSSELVFSHVNGEIGAKVTTQGPAMSTKALWYERVLPGVRSADPDAKINFKEKRIVNRRPILAVQMSATIEGDSWGIYSGPQNLDQAIS
jgi:hypothetical protein